MFLLENFLKTLFLFFNSFVSSYGLSILLLSVSVSIILAPFYHLTYKLELKEKTMRNILKPYIDKIHLISDPQIRHKHLQKLYKSYGYLPLFSLRSLSSLFIQIPFFIAAYNFLESFEPLKGVSFLFIKDMSAPDQMFLGLNILPIAMTLINFASAIFMSSGEGERKQSFAVAIFFLILLYVSPSALVLYWTSNNFLNLARYFFLWAKENEVSLIFKKALLVLKKRIFDDRTFLFFCALSLYFAINILSYGNFDRDTIPVFYLMWGAMFIAMILKTIKLLSAQKLKRHFKKKTAGIIVFAVFLIIRMYQDEKTYYMLIVLLALLILDRKRIEIRSFKDYLSGSFFAFCAAIFPTMIYVAPNMMYFSGNDLIAYLALLISFAALLPIVFSFLAPIKTNQINNFSVSFILAAYFLPLIRAQAKWTGELPIDFILLFSIFLFIIFLMQKHIKILAVFFLCGALYGGYAAINAKAASDISQSSVKQDLNFIAHDLESLQMKDTASVYLFMQDAFPRKDLALALGIDYEEVERVLGRYGFKIYDVYSLADHTRAAMASLFSLNGELAKSININETDAELPPDHPIFSRWGAAMNGNSFVYDLLISKGYSVYIEGKPLKKDNDISQLIMNRYGAVPQVALALMQGYLDTMRLKYYADLPAMITAKFAALAKDRDKIFAWGHGGPDHSTLQGYDIKTERRWWIPKYYKSVKDIEKEIELTVKNNPSAIVIIMSDHGPFMLGKNGMRHYRELKPEEITELHFRDQYGAFMAVRWPDKDRASKYDEDFYVVQDLFPIVLAYLYDSREPLKYKIKDKSVRMRGLIFNKGRIIR